MPESLDILNSALTALLSTLAILGVLWKRITAFSASLQRAIDKRFEDRAKALITQLENELMAKINENADERARAFKDELESELMLKINESAERRERQLQEQIIGGIRDAFGAR